MYCGLYSEHLATVGFVVINKINLYFTDDSLNKEIPQFTEAEKILFKKRFEEGYDLTSDDRYNTWLKLQDTAGKL